MLRRIIKAIIPSKGEVFFNFFVEAATNAHESAKIFTAIINTNDKIIYLSFVGTKSVDFVYHNTIISSAEVIQ